MCGEGDAHRQIEYHNLYTSPPLRKSHKSPHFCRDERQPFCNDGRHNLPKRSEGYGQDDERSGWDGH